MNRLARVARSASTYSVSLVWVAGIALAAGVQRDAVAFSVGALGFTLIAVLAVLVAMLREMRTVHALVEIQRIELTGRIVELTTALKDAGIPVPRQQNRRSTDPSDSTLYRRRR